MESFGPDDDRHRVIENVVIIAHIQYYTVPGLDEVSSAIQIQVRVRVPVWILYCSPAWDKKAFGQKQMGVYQ
jgi:hypothetical protein